MRVGRLVHGERRALVGEDRDVDVVDRARAARVGQEARVVGHLDEAAEPLALGHLSRGDDGHGPCAGLAGAGGEGREEGPRVELPGDDPRRTELARAHVRRGRVRPPAGGGDQENERARRR